MTEPCVSVLVPCYNKEAYLEATLESVYAQQFRDFEIVVVDDGSSDRSPEVLRRHEGRVRAIFQANQGASAARQRALGEARGRYIQYLDADDLLLPTALATRVAALEAGSADVAYSDWQRFRQSPDGAMQLGEKFAKRIEDVNADAEIACFTSFWSPPAALLYSRRIVERIGVWNPLLPVIQDARYLFDAAFAGARLVHVAGVSALYREDLAQSLSRRSSSAFVADVVRNADQVQALWESRGVLEHRHRAALADCYGYAARAAFRHDDALFERCCAHLARMEHPRTTLRWPTIAATLKRGIGKRAALVILGIFGRPAP